MGDVVNFDPCRHRKWKARRQTRAKRATSYPLKRAKYDRVPSWIPGLALAFGIGILVVAMFTSPMASGIGCNIKGNVSSSGELVFHVPGQEYYGLTIINPMKGERWFCTEEEARAAGWRKAYR